MKTLLTLLVIALTLNATLTYLTYREIIKLTKDYKNIKKTIL